MSRILSRISMLTGQISSHALHDRARPDLLGRDALEQRVGRDGDLAVDADGRRHRSGSPVAAMTSPDFSTISRGSSGLPVAWAGHTRVQRPHIVQASVSSSCFHVKSSTTDAPKVSSDVSVRLGIGFMAPLGRSRSFRYMFSGDVNMCRSMVMGRITRNAKNASTWAIHMTWCQRSRVLMLAPSTSVAQRVADEAPLLEVGRALGGDAEHLGGEARHADQQRRCRG